MFKIAHVRNVQFLRDLGQSLKFKVQTEIRQICAKV